MAREEENRDDDDPVDADPEEGLGETDGGRDDEGSEASEPEDDGDDDLGEADDAEGGVAVAAHKVSRPAPKKGDSPGARIAAQKAAKAAAKAAKRGTSVNAIEAHAEQRAELAGAWAERHRMPILAGAAIVILGGVGAVAYSMYASSHRAEAGTALWDAVTAATADVRPGGQAEDAEEETYESREKRAEAALERYDTVLAAHGSAPAAPWARLGRAAQLFELERYADARTEYERVLSDAGGDEVLAWRALEGVALTLDAEEKWDDAIRRLGELRTLSSGAYQNIADYHIARMYLAKGDRDRAKELLRSVVDNLRTLEAEEPTKAMPYVLAQAQVRLEELDPSAARPSAGPGGGFPGGGPGGGFPGGGGDTMDMEQMQQLLKQLQEAQGGGGGPGGAPGGPIQLPTAPPEE